jgi:hypothetical protein
MWKAGRCRWSASVQPVVPDLLILDGNEAICPIVVNRRSAAPATNLGECAADCGTDDAPKTSEDNLQATVFFKGGKYPHCCAENNESDEDDFSHTRKSPERESSRTV